MVELVFFNKSWIDFWLLGIRSGAIPRELFSPVTLCLGLSLPILISFPEYFPLVRKGKFSFLIELLLIATGLFLLSHLLLFNLFLPNRYTSHSFHLIIALASGISITIILDKLLSLAVEAVTKFKQAKKLLKRKSYWLLSMLYSGLITILVMIILLYPVFLKKFTSPNYIEPEESALYHFLAQYPKSTLIASLSEEADNIPSFAQQSVLVAWEYALPYQNGYYHQIRQRAIDLIDTQYSLNIENFQTLILKYNIDLILLDTDAFTPEYLQDNPWFKQWKLKAQKIQQSRNLAQMYPSRLIQSCSVYQTSNFILLEAKCILDIPKNIQNTNSR
ncbi:MAG: hypothetical protein HC825_03930 [Oscillatoriales cyanobacterium RM1_1_9]|nr:hypothetical protein [Oscillatoriales cyanobacterium RM1_1_9]